MRVWVTRAQPGAQATARRLRERGHDPVVEPLLVVHPFPKAQLDFAGIGAVAFTSANGVEAYAALTPRRDLVAFAIGGATAAAARAAGFAEVVDANGDVDALAALVAARRGMFRGAVLHPCARQPAGDLAGALGEAGIQACTAPVYKTAAVQALPEAILADESLEAVLLHSPRAARTLAALLPAGRAQHLAAYALSPACAAPLEGCGFSRVRVAPFPNEAAMLTLMET